MLPIHILVQGNAIDAVTMPPRIFRRAFAPTVMRSTIARLPLFALAGARNAYAYSRLIIAFDIIML